MTFLQTNSGANFDFNKPDESMINIRDIAHSLARIRRFNGHTDANCSVALHSVIMSRIVPEEFAIPALLHDAHEAYTGDLSSPIKALLGGAIKDIERRIDRAISKRFKVNLEPCKTVKKFDLKCLAYEKNSFLPNPDAEWECLAGDTPAKVPSELNKYYYIDDVKQHEMLFINQCRKLGRL